MFRDRPVASRLYRYKWADYQNLSALEADLEARGLDLDTGLPPSNSRFAGLELLWRSYEEIAFQVPESPVREAFASFYDQARGPSLDPWKQNGGPTRRCS
jgi:hypothetical protein